MKCIIIMFGDVKIKSSDLNYIEICSHYDSFISLKQY